ncbi:hypothetical protein BBP40_010395 [Aspergillus hancockii]|nr:hypothetical protein BBP40_010395 [Aspergillus hancockii]
MPFYLKGEDPTTACFYCGRCPTATNCGKCGKLDHVTEKYCAQQYRTPNVRQRQVPTAAVSTIEAPQSKEKAPEKEKGSKTTIKTAKGK